jgi:hypothetical protein
VRGDVNHDVGVMVTTSLRVAVIDGPYDAVALSRVLAGEPVSLGDGRCGVTPRAACCHGTFVLGLLGARVDAPIPGLCPDATLMHVPLFVDELTPRTRVERLADAISTAVAAGARLINLSLSITGSKGRLHAKLAAALDAAEASGAVAIVAAGNQGRVAGGQLLSHPVTIPVVAVDDADRLLPQSNYGPLIMRRGIAARGNAVLSYAPGGGITAMSGTSVAAAVATGLLARFWHEHPELDGAAVRARLVRLGPRYGPTPPIITPDVLAPPHEPAPSTVASETAQRADHTDNNNFEALQGQVSLQGQVTMTTGSGAPPSQRPIDVSVVTRGKVVPAGGACACGAPGGVCTCADGEVPWRFIYALGTVDIRFPDQSISEELQRVARALEESGAEVKIRPNEPLRTWYGRVLRHREARYVARLVCWVLTIEGHPAYYLALRDWHDLAALVQSLGHPASEDESQFDDEDFEPAEHEDLDLFVGTSTLIPVTSAPGLSIPVLMVDHLHSYKETALTASMKTLPKGKNPRDLYKSLVQSADNLGDTDEWRALNFIAVNYAPLYEKYAELTTAGYYLDSVKVRASRLARERRIFDPVFSFLEPRSGAAKKFFVRVDVSHLFPMLVGQLSDYFDR